MAPSNAALLTRQSVAWAHKKRARQGQVKEIVFDEEARREYLTGFRKRNAERKKAAKAKATEREKQEHLEERRQMRKELKERAQTNFEAVEKAYGGAALEFVGISSVQPEEHEEEYSDEEQLATVAVIEDFDPTTDMLGPQKTRPEAEDGEQLEGQRQTKRLKPTAQKPNSEKKSNPKPKPSKIRYETKAAARAAHVKALAQRRKAKDKRVTERKSKSKSRRK
ncbi:Nucleolar protein 12 (25kDa) [Rhizoctonia solani]|uniref:Nucleolar protein 12 (25kDa) n=1 Tax=Rhizoctonia solani TaxID=456999 RepID=A0A8H7H0S8_9AGAM|nr:Nucleolar protein 12 (25kDa) [Rhizoctonia solani]